MTNTPHLVFVYGGNATVYELAARALHECQGKQECDISHDHKVLLEALPYEINCYNRNDFFLNFPETAGTELPAVFVRHQHGLQRLMEAEELNHISTLEELKEKLLAKLPK